MKNITIIIISILCNIAFCNETLGLVTKTKGKVEYQKFSVKNYNNWLSGIDKSKRF